MGPRPPTGFTGVQKSLHWVMALLIAGMIGLGLTLPRLAPGPLADALYEVHKSSGMLVLVLALARLAVRLRHGAPALDPALPRWQRLAAGASHVALYALMIAMPAVGWIATSACCRPVRFLWAVPATLPVPADDAAAKLLFALHLALGLALVAVVAVHVAAALHHHFVRRDDTLRRMLPAGRGVRAPAP